MTEPPLLQAVGPTYEASSDQQANAIPVRLSAREIETLKDILNNPNEKGFRDHGSGGGGNMGDSDRITRLETHFEYIQRDLSDLKTGQQRIGEALHTIGEKITALPTRSDLSSWRTQWIAICVGAIALIVGGIIGGLSWIKSDPAPIVIRSDASQPVTVPSANTQPTPAKPNAPAPRP